MSEQFVQSLAFGHLAEGQIEAWLRRARRFSVLPVYEGGRAKKGPRLFTPTRALVSPDMLAIRGKDIRWVEAKHKTYFTWYRIGKVWTTGIDSYYFDQYVQLSELTEIPVWILFLHSRSDSVDGNCPTGLFGADVFHLRGCVDHEYKAYGKGGMLYWKHDDLHLLASIADVRAAAIAMGYREKLGEQP